MSGFKKTSPRVASQVKTHNNTTTSDHHYQMPKLPKGVPPAHLSPPVTIKPSMSAQASSTAPIEAAPLSAPTGAGYNPAVKGMQISSLGPKRTALATPVKKVAANAPSMEDDIFASMGLAAIPKFSHAPTAVASKPAAGAMSTSTMNSNRWTASSPSTQTAPVASKLVSSGNSLDGADADDNWDDDGDLDDLLDD